MKNSVLTAAFLIVTLLTAMGCKEEKMKTEDLKNFYTISLGDHIFRVPVEYLMDADNRKDGPQRYVRIMAKIPDLKPYENARYHTNPPSRDSEGISFNLNYGDGKIFPPDSLLHHWSMKGQNYTVPEVWDKEGLVHLGTFLVGGKRKENIYAFIRNGEPIAQLSCGTYPDWPNPGCNVYQGYRDRMMSIHLHFDIERLDWYVEEGMEKVLHKVDSWRVEPDKQ
jgi:hypothetical protein